MILNPCRILYFRKQIDKILKNEIPDPVMLEFFLTQKCNHSCDSCLFKDYHLQNQILTKTVLKTLKEVQGRVSSIEYCGGGEPTLHSEFVKIVKYGRKLGFHQGLITNGSTLLRYKNQIGQHLNYVRISLDASNAMLHKKIHKSDDFNTIIEGIKLLVQEQNPNLTIGLKFLVMKENKDDIKNFVSLAKELGVHNVQIKAVRNSSNVLTSDEELEVAETIKDVAKEYPKFVFGNIDKSISKTSWCKSNLLSSFVNAEGNMFICCYFQNREAEHSFGNLYQKNFWDIWYSNEHLEKIRNIDLKKCNTYDCRYHQYNQILEELEKSFIFI